MSNSTVHVWRPNTARLLVMDAGGPVARGAMPIVPEPLCWPAKDPADVLDYQFDASAVVLSAEGDGIASLGVTLAPVEPNGLDLMSAVADGPRAVLWLSGGVAGHTYTLTISMMSESGRSITRDVSLPVRQLSSPMPGSPLLAGAVPITTNSGSPITVS